jgi:hypothetical protein
VATRLLLLLLVSVTFVATGCGEANRPLIKNRPFIAVAAGKPVGSDFGAKVNWRVEFTRSDGSIFRTISNARAPVLSPNGEAVAFLRPAAEFGFSGLTGVASIAGGAIVFAPTPRTIEVERPVWSPDGSAVLFGQGNPVGKCSEKRNPPITVVRVGRGARQIAALPRATTNVYVTSVVWAGDSIAYSVGTFPPNGESTGFCAYDAYDYSQDVYVVRVDGTQRRKVARGVVVAAAPDGRRILIRERRGLSVVAVSSGHATLVVPSSAGDVAASDWSEAEPHVVIDDGRNLTLVTLNASGRAAPRVRLTRACDAWDVRWRRHGLRGPLRLVLACSQQGDPQHVFAEVETYDLGGKLTGRVQFPKPRGRVVSEDIAL